MSSTHSGLGETGSPAAPAAAVPVPRSAADADTGAEPGTLSDSQRRYKLLVRASDATIITFGVLIGILSDSFETAAATQAHAVSGLAAGVLLLVGAPVARAWDARILGAGSVEFKRLSHAVISAVLLLALVGVAFTVVSVRPWVLVNVPMIGAACAAARFALRKWLHHQRRYGRCLLPVLAVGGDREVADLVARTTRDRHFGWAVTGACTPTGHGGAVGRHLDGVPVVGDLDDVPRLALTGRYGVVAVAPTPGWGPSRLHQLSWELENTSVELAVHPGLMEIGGPRLHIAPLDGMPLLRLTQPRFTGAARLLKNAVDRAGAALLLTLLAPILLAIAVAVRLDGGPALYLQERVGVRGQRFRMVKFRSMAVDAEARLAELTASNNGNGPLFKMHHDPRVTRTGALLRRYSLDELPQLFNVLAGSMSLVGPRPPLPGEVETYGMDAQRRLLVRPGVTGLWQVSGRSDLSWEESVRLDLRYVENWSLAVDAAILWKTLGAVLRGRGAY